MEDFEATMAALPAAVEASQPQGEGLPQGAVPPERFGGRDWREPDMEYWSREVAEDAENAAEKLRKFEEKVEDRLAAAEAQAAADRRGGRKSQPAGENGSPSHRVDRATGVHANDEKNNEPKVHFTTLWYYGRFRPNGTLSGTGSFFKAFCLHLFKCGVVSMGHEAYQARDTNANSRLRAHLDAFLKSPGRDVRDATKKHWEDLCGLKHSDLEDAFGAWRTLDGQLPVMHSGAFREWFSSINLETPEEVKQAMESHSHLHHIIHLSWKRWCVMLVDPCEYTVNPTLQPIR
jgi:hypothetical protein